MSPTETPRPSERDPQVDREPGARAGADESPTTSAASVPGAAPRVVPVDAAHRRGTIRAYLVAIAAGVVLDVVVIVIALIVGGDAPLAALLGSVLALVISVPSLVPALVTLDKGISTFAVVVLGVWLVKMIVLIGGVLLVRGIDGLPMPWVGVALLAGGLASLITEAVVLLRIRTDPQPLDGPGRT